MKYDAPGSYWVGVWISSVYASMCVAGPLNKLLPYGFNVRLTMVDMSFICYIPSYISFLKNHFEGNIYVLII